MILVDNLRCHCDRIAQYGRLLNFIPHLNKLGETQIDDDPFIIVEHDVTGMQISMHDVIAVQIVQSLCNLVQMF